MPAFLAEFNAMPGNIYPKHMIGSTVSCQPRKIHASAAPGVQYSQIIASGVMSLNHLPGNFPHAKMPPVLFL
jgi:hypothetical protein